MRRNISLGLVAVAMLALVSFVKADDTSTTLKGTMTCASAACTSRTNARASCKSRTATPRFSITLPTVMPRKGRTKRCAKRRSKM